MNIELTKQLPPKEKAKELKLQFKENTRYVVLEIIEQFKEMRAEGNEHPVREEYWNEVKNELNKLT